jgi:hypothetical protein
MAFLLHGLVVLTIDVGQAACLGGAGMMDRTTAIDSRLFSQTD